MPLIQTLISGILVEKYEISCRGGSTPPTPFTRCRARTDDQHHCGHARASVLRVLRLLQSTVGKMKFCKRSLRFPDHLPHQNSPHGQFAPRQLAPQSVRPMDNSPHGQLTPGTPCPMENPPHDNSSYRQLAPQTTRPMTTRPITYDKKFIVYYFINTFDWSTLHCTVTQIKHLWHARKTGQTVSDKPHLILNISDSAP
jgi:hypothetical protein